MKKESLHDELEGLSPWLRDMKRADDGFQMPPDYFERLEADVFSQIEAIGARKRAPAKPPAADKVSWLQRAQSWFWRPRIALSLGGFAAVALAAWYFMQSPSPEQATIASVETPVEETPVLPATQISPEDAEQWMSENIMDFEPEQLALHMPEEAAAPTQTPTPSEKKDKKLPPETLDRLLQELSEEELKEMEML